MKRAAAQQEMFAQGALYLGTYINSGRSYDVYFLPEDEDGPDEVHLHQEDRKDERKVTDMGRITRKYHGGLCDMVERCLARLHARISKAMEDPEISAQ